MELSVSHQQRDHQIVRGVEVRLLAVTNLHEMVTERLGAAEQRGLNILLGRERVGQQRLPRADPIPAAHVGYEQVRYPRARGETSKGAAGKSDGGEELQSPPCSVHHRAHAVRRLLATGRAKNLLTNSFASSRHF